MYIIKIILILPNPQILETLLFSVVDLNYRKRKEKLILKFEDGYVFSSGDHFIGG
jgi:hypothetical protein